LNSTAVGLQRNQTAKTGPSSKSFFRSSHRLGALVASDDHLYLDQQRCPLLARSGHALLPAIYKNRIGYQSQNCEGIQH
jgi:hypothetical protein